MVGKGKQLTQRRMAPAFTLLEGTGILAQLFALFALFLLNMPEALISDSAIYGSPPPPPGGRRHRTDKTQHRRVEQSGGPPGFA